MSQSSEVERGLLPENKTAASTSWRFSGSRAAPCYFIFEPCCEKHRLHWRAAARQFLLMLCAIIMVVHTEPYIYAQKGCSAEQHNKDPDAASFSDVSLSQLVLLFSLYGIALFQTRIRRSYLAACTKGAQINWMQIAVANECAEEDFSPRSCSMKGRELLEQIK